MRESILGLPASSLAIWGLAISILSVTVSALGTVIVLVHLPADAFVATRAGVPTSLPRRVLRVLRNGLGWGIVLMGFVLLVPGVPGQGLLTIVLGLLLVDLPGKSRLLARILARKGVRRSVDRLRARFGRPPFIWPNS